MQEYRFQFQYDPNDLKAIRSASGLVYFSPATTITIWACGFAICLLMLGAIGSWTVLTVVVIVAMFFLVFYVNGANRRSRGDREYLIRTLTLTETGVSESFGHSFFEKAWDAFEEFQETRDHFLLRHFEKVTALPKRVIPEDQLGPCRKLINERMGKNSTAALKSFDDWFGSETKTRIFRFRWTDEDVQHLMSEQLRVFDRSGSEVKSSSNSKFSRVFGTLILLAGVFLLMLALPGGRLRDASSWVSILLFPVAISIPFVVAYLWWKYTNKVLKNRNPRIPTDEIHVTLNDTDLLIGYTKAVARYSLQDISSFFISDRFIGFRPHNGMIHVVANHAFGGPDQAVEFLLHADQLRRQNEGKPRTDDEKNLTAAETGNPYQPPSYLN
jgi:uncharacterized protein YneF (UPF0154 family)